MNRWWVTPLLTLLVAVALFWGGYWFHGRVNERDRLRQKVLIDSLLVRFDKLHELAAAAEARAAAHDSAAQVARDSAAVWERRARESGRQTAAAREALALATTTRDSLDRAIMVISKQDTQISSLEAALQSQKEAFARLSLAKAEVDTALAAETSRAKALEEALKRASSVTPPKLSFKEKGGLSAKEEVIALAAVVAGYIISR